MFSADEQALFLRFLKGFRSLYLRSTSRRGKSPPPALLSNPEAPSGR